MVDAICNADFSTRKLDDGHGLAAVDDPHVVEFLEFRHQLLERHVLHTQNALCP